MIDSKSIQHNRDSKVANDNTHLVAHLARMFALTIPEVRELIARHGVDRQVLKKEAIRLNS